LLCNWYHGQKEAFLNLENCDLHIHSSYSDGALSPESLIDQALDHALDVISITDHDTVEAYSGDIQLDIRRPLIIPGVEITAQLHGEAVHLLGYCFDPHDRGLETLLRSQRIRREEWAREMFPQTSSALLFRGKTLTRKELVRESVHLSGRRGSLAKIPVRKAIRSLHDAGGVAVLAHPGLSLSPPETLVRALKPLGLDGLEVYYPYRLRAPGRFPGRKEEEAFHAFLLSLASKYGLLATGGSDTHHRRLQGWSLEKVPSLPCLFS